MRDVKDIEVKRAPCRARTNRSKLHIAVTACAVLAGGLAPRPGASQARTPGESGVSLTLSRALRSAIGQNPQIETARYQLQEAEGRVSEAWGSVYPSVDFNTNYTRNLSAAVNFLPAQFFDPGASPDDQIAVQFGADNLWQSTLVVEQPLFRAAVFIGVGAAGRFESLQEEVLRGEVQTVVTRVRTAYYQALLAQEQVRLTENSVRRVRETLEETRALFRAGLSS